MNFINDDFDKNSISANSVSGATSSHDSNGFGGAICFINTISDINFTNTNFTKNSAYASTSNANNQVKS